MTIQFTGPGATTTTIVLPAGVDALDALTARRRAASTPEGLRDRLYVQLHERLPLVVKLMDYMEGRHAFTFATEGFQQYAKMLGAIADNWMPLMVNAVRERLALTGVRLSTPGLAADAEDPFADDPAAWDLFRRSDLDEHFPALLRDSISIGEAYLLAERAGTLPDGRPDVRITVEHASTMIVQRDGHDPTKITAALKAWVDEWGIEHATLWTADTVYRWERAGTRAWQPPALGDPPEERHGFPGVPVEPIVNDPQTTPALPPRVLTMAPHGLRAGLAIGLGRSDLLDFFETQDALNAIVRNMLFTAEFQSFRQRWVTGFVPEKDNDGNDIQPFRPGPGHIWRSEDDTVKFGSFEEASLEPFIKASESRLQSMSSRSRIPLHYFLGQSGQIPSGESLRGSEAGLVCRSTDKQKPVGGGVRRLLGRTLPVVNPALAVARVDPVWADPEIRTESEHVDAVIKKLAAKVPIRQVWTELGYTDDQVKEFRGWLRQEAAEAFLFDPLNPESQGDPTQTAAAETREAAGIGT